MGPVAASWRKQQALDSNFVYGHNGLVVDDRMITGHRRWFVCAGMAVQSFRLPMLGPCSLQMLQERAYIHPSLGYGKQSGDLSKICQ